MSGCTVEHKTPRTPWAANSARNGIVPSRIKGSRMEKVAPSHPTRTVGFVLLCFHFKPPTLPGFPAIGPRKRNRPTGRHEWSISAGLPSPVPYKQHPASHNIAVFHRSDMPRTRNPARCHTTASARVIGSTSMSSVRVRSISSTWLVTPSRSMSLYFDILIHFGYLSL